MGVILCNRLKCKNILCERLSIKYGPICNDCFAELVSYGVDVDIGKFMDEEEDVKKVSMEEAYEKYDKEFPK